jgi:hypothetical protein
MAFRASDFAEPQPMETRELRLTCCLTLLHSNHQLDCVRQEGSMDIAADISDCAR